MIAALYFPPPPDVHREKHLRTCLAHAAARRYQVRSLASHFETVLALVEAGLVAVVLSAARWRESHHDELEVAAAAYGARVEVIRQVQRRRLSVDPTAAKLLALGLTVEQVADALGVPVEQVRTVAAVAAPRQQPADHPWRRPAPVVDLDAQRRARRAG
jgi:hypothetical protein